jgi:hypothetical protein
MSRGNKEREKERKDLDEMDSTRYLGDAKGLTVDELTSLLAEGYIDNARTKKERKIR